MQYFSEVKLGKLNIHKTDYIYRNDLEYKNECIYIKTPIIHVNLINMLYINFECTKIFSQFYYNLYNAILCLMWKNGIVSYHQRVNLLPNQFCNQIIMKMNKNVLIYDNEGNTIQTIQVKNKQCEIVFKPKIIEQILVCEVEQIKLIDVTFNEEKMLL